MIAVPSSSTVLLGVAVVHAPCRLHLSARTSHPRSRDPRSTNAPIARFFRPRNTTVSRETCTPTQISRHCLRSCAKYTARQLTSSSRHHRGTDSPGDRLGVGLDLASSAPRLGSEPQRQALCATKHQLRGSPAPLLRSASHQRLLRHTGSTGLHIPRNAHHLRARPGPLRVPIL